jgi:hypothetical protein
MDVVLSRAFSFTVFDGAQPSFMSIRNIYIIRLVSYLLAFVVGLSMGSMVLMTQAEAPDPNYTTHISEDLLGFNKEDRELLRERAAKIDAFYISKGNLPFAGYGMHMVLAAEQSGIPWNLLAAIGFIESTGGKFACTSVSFSGFGWGSCKISFSSFEESIHIISHHLGGHHPNTARYYQGKTLEEIIDTYNPPSVRADYQKLILQTMENIESMTPDFRYIDN